MVHRKQPRCDPLGGGAMSVPTDLFDIHLPRDRLNTLTRGPILMPKEIKDNCTSSTSPTYRTAEIIYIKML